MSLNKIVITNLLCIWSGIAIASMGEADYSNVSDQFKNRGWDIYASENIRQSHFLNYGDSSTLNKLKNLYRSIQTNFFNILSQDYDYQDLNLYYPHLETTSDSNVVKLSTDYEKLGDLYELIGNWSDLFGALEVDIWKDLGTCDGNILTNENCGRESRVNYVLQLMPLERRKKLTGLREALRLEIAFASKLNAGMNYDSNLVRTFQFLNDNALLGSLINSKIFSSGVDLEKKEKLFVESARAIILQVFRVNGGRVMTSDSLLIDIEPESCNLSCMYTYYKGLLYTPGIPSGNQVSNLIFDPKMIPYAADYYLSIKTDNEKRLFESNLNDFLKDVIGLDLSSEDLSEIEKEKVREFLEDTINYLHGKPSVNSLLLAKSLEKFIKEVLND